MVTFFPEDIIQQDGIYPAKEIVIVSVGVATINTLTIITNTTSGMLIPLVQIDLKNLEVSINNQKNSQMFT